MKKVILIIALAISTLTSNAEVWFDIGVKGAFAPGVFSNPYIIGSSDQQLEFSPGMLLGGKLGVNFGLTHSVTIDFLYAETRQKMYSAAVDITNSLSLKSFDLPIMYRMNQDNGGYGEIGPQFSFTLGGTKTAGGVSTDAKSMFNSSNFGVAFGFGQYIGGGDAFGFNMGFRFAYTLADIVTSSFANETNDPVYTPYSADEVAAYTYKASGRFYAGVALEFNFNLGYLAKGAKCTKRTKFKLF